MLLIVESSYDLATNQLPFSYRIAEIGLDGCGRYRVKTARTSVSYGTAWMRLGRPWTLFDVLHLLAHLLDDDLHVDRGARRLEVLRLR